MKKLVSLAIAISDISISTSIVTKESSSKEGLEDARPTIETYRTKSFNPERADITYSYLEGRLKTLLESVLKETRYEDLKKINLNVNHISKVTVSLAAPWFEGKTVISHFDQAKEFKVTKAIVDKTFDTEIKAIAGNDKEDITLLETNILNSTLNGYSIQEPVGKMATSLSLAGYVSYTKTSLRNILTEVLDSYFHNISEIIIKTEPTLLLSAAQKEAEIMNIKTDFAIIRVNEIMTHIQIVRNNHISELGTVPIGLNNILKDISDNCKVTYEVAVNLLTLYFAKNLESSHVGRIEPLIDKVLDTWRKGIKDFSTNSIMSGSFPSHVFLSSPSILSHVLKDYLMKDNYLDLTMSEKNLTIDILDRSSLNNFVAIAESVEGDPGFLTKLNAMI